MFRQALTRISYQGTHARPWLGYCRCSEAKVHNFTFFVPGTRSKVRVLGTYTSVYSYECSFCFRQGAVFWFLSEHRSWNICFAPHIFSCLAPSERAETNFLRSNNFGYCCNWSLSRLRYLCCRLLPFDKSLWHRRHPWHTPRESRNPENEVVREPG